MGVRFRDGRERGWLLGGFCVWGGWVGLGWFLLYYFYYMILYCFLLHYIIYVGCYWDVGDFLLNNLVDMTCWEHIWMKCLSWIECEMIIVYILICTYMYRYCNYVKLWNARQLIYLFVGLQHTASEQFVLLKLCCWFHVCRILISTDRLSYLALHPNRKHMILRSEEVS